jgi:hypothetical protein
MKDEQQLLAIRMPAILYLPAIARGLATVSNGLATISN